MTKEQLIQFLLNKPGYLKEGYKRLARKLSVDSSVAKEALREARKIIGLKSNDRMKLKSVWQTAGGDWRYSYRLDDKSSDELAEFKEELIGAIKGLAPTVKKHPTKRILKDLCLLELSLPDMHFGKIDGLTIAEQADLFVEAVGDLLGKVAGYNVERIIIPIGNDVFNSEGMRQTTTKGTPQRDNEDWRKIYAMGWKAVAAAILTASEYIPVDVVIVPGNHDFERTYYLGETLAAYFNNNENVTVYNDGECRFYYKYGKTLLGYTHGDKEKPYELPLIMATERPLEFSQTTHRSWRLGHLHKHMKDEFRGVEVEFLPALCGDDEWHRQMGYATPRRATATIWNKKGGKDATLILNR